VLIFLYRFLAWSVLGAAPKNNMTQNWNKIPNKSMIWLKGTPKLTESCTLLRAFEFSTKKAT